MPQDVDLPQIVIHMAIHITRGKMKEIEGPLENSYRVAFAIAASGKQKYNTVNTEVEVKYSHGCLGPPEERASEGIGDQERELNPTSLSPPSPVSSPPNIQQMKSNPPSSPFSSISKVKSGHIASTIMQSFFDAEDFAHYKKYQVAVHTCVPEVTESSY